MEKVETRWGHYTNVLEFKRGEKKFKLKMLHIDPNKNISYQHHENRGENWVVTNGSGVLVQDGAFYELSQGVSLNVPVGSKHAVKAGEKGLEIVEVQFGSECEEDDIERHFMEWSDIVRFVSGRLEEKW